MKKRFFFGLIAVALIALNALAFASFAAPPSPYPPGFHDSGCYQTMGNCGRFIRQTCTSLYTSSQCVQYYCSSCAQHDEPSMAKDDEFFMMPKYNF